MYNNKPDWMNIWYHLLFNQLVGDSHGFISIIIVSCQNGPLCLTDS